jgi:hypothetical protein
VSPVTIEIARRVGRIEGEQAAQGIAISARGRRAVSTEIDSPGCLFSKDALPPMPGGSTPTHQPALLGGLKSSTTKSSERITTMFLTVHLARATVEVASESFLLKSSPKESFCMLLQRYELAVRSLRRFHCEA